MPEENQGQDDNRYYQKAMEKLYRKAQEEEKIKSLMRQLLDPDAYERMMNIKASNGDLYMQFANLLIQLVQANQIKGRISDSQLRSLLERLTSRPDPKINIKHK
ncbi:PDCD5 family DNA-binding protein [Candidatus Mancarchaeum acidiphilum]|uniref:PDCD5 family DNA-binding protein n=1 Tax=Candidatus Mancarchaeum acidiphilum TaxID=1920749 RepID=A0A218NP20_9ARCH|nr:DNA-binding protein [Candidatus Mancarchaeum acidiphilum]ASI14205.1 PDCD5 family DNA-binding protein [Candidatus Mancarchaeum acidiphilum]